MSEDNDKKSKTFINLLAALFLALAVGGASPWWWPELKAWLSQGPAEQDLVNIAPGSRLTASNASPAAHLAADGDIYTSWNAGGRPTQWIDLEFPKPANIAKINLVIEQLPDGETRHIILGRYSGSSGYKRLYEFEGPTKDKGELTHSPQGLWKGIDRIRIETAKSESWVSWREIEVYVER